MCSVQHFVTSHRMRLSSFISDWRKRQPSYYDELLGCTIAMFRSHLESQFTKEMSFENYGSYWTIDHRHPLLEISQGEFIPMDEIKSRMNYMNTRPMLKFENNSKSNKPYEASQDC